MKVVIIVIIIYFYIHLNFIRKKSIKNYDVNYSTIHGVPKIIHRTHNFTSDKRLVSSMMFELCNKRWIDLNPNYSMKWYSNQQCDTFMKSMDEKIYNSYIKLKPGAYKADLWRACILYEYGGVYVDSYTVPYISLSLMLSGCWDNTTSKHQFISAKDVDHVYQNKKKIAGIHNGFIICTPKHPFMEQYIKDMVKHIEDEYYGDHFLDITGPLCLIKSVNKANGEEEYKIPKKGWNREGKFNYYLFDYHLDLNQNIYKDKYIIMSKKYSLLSFLYEKICNRKRVYSYMWKRRDVYNL